MNNLPTRAAFGNGGFRGYAPGALARLQGGAPGHLTPGRLAPARGFGGGFSGGGLAGPTLGQTATEWFERAKNAVAAYENLRDNILPRLANLQARAEITTWLGTVYQDETPEYRWASVVGDITYDVAREGVGAYNVERRQGRVEKLEEINDQFRDKVGAAGALLPAPKPEPEPGVPQPPPTVEFPDIGTPIAVGLGAVALAVLIGSLA